MRECASLFLLLLFSNIVRFENDKDPIDFILEARASELTIVDD
jgi:hypothetical protein